MAALGRITSPPPNYPAPDEDDLPIAVPTARQVTQNFLWLAADRAIRFLINFAVSIAMIRHLGPTDNGLFATLMSIFTIGAAATECGVESLLRRDLVRTGNSANTLMATTVALRFGATVLILPFCLWAALAASGDDPARWPLATTLAVLLLQPCSLVFVSWFNARTASKHAVWAQTAGVALSTVSRAMLIFAGLSVAWFGIPILLEVIVSSILLAWFFRREGGTWQRWQWNAKVAREFWRGGWPLLLTNLAILLYTRVDVLILQAMGDSSVAGIYAAATRLSDLATLVPLLLITSTTAALTALHRDDIAAYQRRLQQLTTGVTWFAILTATALTVLARPIVQLLYGEDFAAAAPVMALHVWGAVFAAQGSARALWLLLEDRQHYGLLFVLLGLAVNLSLNVTLIPAMGAQGAAIAAVAAQFTVAWIAPALFAPTRPTLRLLIGSLLLRTRA